MYMHMLYHRANKDKINVLDAKACPSLDYLCDKRNKKQLE